MKAIAYPHYGAPDVLRFEDLPLPKPAAREVLIRLRAAAVNPLDFHQMRGHVRLMTGLFGPRQHILGCDIAGTVSATGSQVTGFQPGDDVFGVTGFSGGGFAEYVCSTPDRLALKPPNLTFEEAAAIPIAALTALQGLRDKGRIRAGQNVLIDGASGGVGTFAVQLAKSFGANVTAACSPRNVAIAKSLGADRVIDYTQEDCTRGPERYDLIFGANAFHSLFDYRRALTPDGIFVMAGGGSSLQGIFNAAVVGPILLLFTRRKSTFFIAKFQRQDLEFLRQAAEMCHIRPVIDRRYPLAQAADAIRYLEEGHAQGKIVLTV